MAVDGVLQQQDDGLWLKQSDDDVMQLKAKAITGYLRSFMDDESEICPLYFVLQDEFVYLETIAGQPERIHVLVRLPSGHRDTMSSAAQVRARRSVVRYFGA